jgi:LPXTG-site transpeptidase (sortase) family protein
MRGARARSRAMRGFAVSMRMFRLLLSGILAAAVIAGAVWYGSQVLEGRRSVRELDRKWEMRPVAAAAPVEVEPGEVAGRIVIPDMGLDTPLIEMANVDDKENLDKGPSHVKGTAMPGTKGNCVIAGHRTTHSRPFWSLDALGQGDEVTLVDLAGGRHTYIVDQVLVVDPDDTSVMNPTPEPGVTLIACHPRFSARSRLVVKGTIRGADEVSAR